MVLSAQAASMQAASTLAVLSLQCIHTQALAPPLMRRLPDDVDAATMEIETGSVTEELKALARKGDTRQMLIVMLSKWHMDRNGALVLVKKVYAACGKTPPGSGGATMNILMTLVTERSWRMGLALTLQGQKQENS